MRKASDRASKSGSRARPLPKIFEANSSAEQEGSGFTKKGLKRKDLVPVLAEEEPAGLPIIGACGCSTDENARKAPEGVQETDSVLLEAPSE